MTRKLVTLSVLLLLCASTLSAQSDPKAAQLRDLLKKYSGKVVVLTWSTRTSAMGQSIDSTSSATAVMCGERGLFMLSNQPFASNVSGMASMFGGRGGGAAPSGS